MSWKPTLPYQINERYGHSSPLWRNAAGEWRWFDARMFGDCYEDLDPEETLSGAGYGDGTGQGWGSIEATTALGMNYFDALVTLRRCGYNYLDYSLQWED